MQINKKITTTNNNTYKHYSMVNVNDNHTTSKTTKVINVTTKRIPCYIHQDNLFCFNKTIVGSGSVDLSNYYTKEYVDPFAINVQNLFSILSNRVVLLESQYNALTNQPPQPGNQY